MSALEPGHLGELIAEAERNMERALKVYELLYDAAYATRRSGSLASGGQKLAEDGTPKGAAAVLMATASARQKLETVSTDIARATDLARGARRAAAQLVGLIDEMASNEQTPDYPPMKTAELKSLRKAQERRRNAVREGNGAMPWTGRDEMP